MSVATLNLLEPCTVAMCRLEGLMRPGLSGTSSRLLWVFANVRALKVARLFNAGISVVDADRVGAMEVLATGGNWALVRTPGQVLPRVYAALPVWVRTRGQAQAALRDRPEADFAREVLLEGEAPAAAVSAVADTVPPGTISVTSYENERVELSVDVPGPRAIVLNDLWARGWTATVDGAPSTIYRANTLVRAVLVPGGHHEVLYTFETPDLRLGGAASLLGLVLVLALCFVSTRAVRT